MANESLSQTHGSRLDGPIPTLKSLLATSVSGRKDNIALAVLDQPKDLYATDATPGHRAAAVGCTGSDEHYLRWTYDQLGHNAHLLASALYARGVRGGDGVAAFLYNCSEWAIGYWASLASGCAFAPVNPSLSLKKEEAQHVLDTAASNVVIVRDGDIAEKLDRVAKEQMQQMKAKIIIGYKPDKPVKGWEYMADVLSTTQLVPGLALTDGPECSEDTAEEKTLIIFTSGTTSLPKGCPHTNRTMTSAVRAQIIGLNLSNGSASVNHIPTSHIFGAMYSQSYWVAGGKVVYPAETFNPASTLRAIELEKTTNFPAVPSLLSALFEHPHFPSTNKTSVVHAELAGAVVLPSNLQDCVEKIGCKTAASTYGMSEGVPTISWPLREGPPPIIRDRTSVGKVTPGAHLRICAPGSRDPVPRGEKGELHHGGMQVIRGYLGGVNSETCYEDEDGPWLISGDQAEMDESGAVFIVGRYKDLIIRGGENISPGAIEAVLNTIRGLSVQVVGAEDEFAGEVPVAIVRWTGEEKLSAHELRELVVRECGKTHALDEVIGLEDLGLQEFPKTSSGKIRKVELVEAVKNYRRSKLSRNPSAKDRGSLLRTVSDIWTRLLGVSRDRIRPETSVLQMADSLTIMQFKSQLQRDLRVNVGLHDLMNSRDVSDQVRLVLEQQQHSSSHIESEDSLIQPAREGPPTAKEMAHCKGYSSRERETRVLLEPLLHGKGLSWERDVEDVLPFHDWIFYFLQRRRLQSFNHRHAYKTTVGKDVLKAAVKKALANNPMMRTLAVDFDASTKLAVVIRASEHWASIAGTDDHHVDSLVDDLPTYKLNDPDLDYAVPPGPLLRWMIVEERSTRHAAVIFQYHHAAFDGFSLPNFYEDIDAVLANSSVNLRAHPHHRYFADSYYNHRSSKIAQDHVTFFKKHLDGLSSYSKSFWPPERNIGRFQGSDIGWCLADGSPSQPEQRPNLDNLASPRGAFGVMRRVQLPGLSVLRTQHSISPAIAATAAVSILNSRLTKTDRAIFSTYEAARSWPFLEEWIAQRLPDPTSINGPTVECVVRNIAIDSQESVGQLLQRLTRQQRDVSFHAHAPCKMLVEALGAQDGSAYEDMLTRQVFNWIPGLAAEASGGVLYRNMQRVQIQSRSDHLIRWTCGLLDDDTFQAALNWDDSQMHMAEVEGVLGRMLTVLAWISQPDSWSRKVGECEA